MQGRTSWLRSLYRAKDIGTNLKDLKICNQPAAGSEYQNGYRLRGFLSCHETSLGGKIQEFPAETIRTLLK